MDSVARPDAPATGKDPALAIRMGHVAVTPPCSDWLRRPLRNAILSELVFSFESGLHAPYDE